MSKISQDEEDLLSELFALRDDPAFTPPPEDFEHAWRTFKARRKKKRSRRRRIAEILLIACVVTAIAVSAAPEDFRERIMNLHLQFGNESSRVSLSAEEQLPWSGDHAPAYLPAGYGAPVESRLQNLRILTYTKAQGETIVFREAESVTAASIDNEKLDAAKEVFVDENKGYLTVKDQTIALVWSKAQRYYVLDIVNASGSISEATAIKIAESVQAVSEIEDGGQKNE